MSKDHRKPPLPHWNSGRGFCRWCGQPVTKPNGDRNHKALWHKPCLSLYLIATRTRNQRAEAYRISQGKCAICKTLHKKNSPLWQADHIHPLHLADHSLPWESLIEMWLPGNLQLLCTSPCHREKSAAELRALYQRRKERITSKELKP